MSSKKSYSATFGYPYLTLHLEIWATEDADNNRSTVSYSMYLQKPSVGGAYNYQNGNHVYLTIGSKVLQTDSWGHIWITDDGSQPAGYKIQLYNSTANGTVTVNHASDGTGSVNFSARFWQSSRTDMDATISGTYTLDTIPRASSLTLSPASGDVGTNVAISIVRNKSTYTHTLSWKSGSRSYTTFATGVATSSSFTIPVEAARAITTAGSGNVTIKCETFNGSTSMGSKTATFKLNVPSEWVPTINSVTVTDGNNYEPTYGAYLQSLSTFHVVISASASGNGESISSYSTNITNLGVYSGASFTTSVITQADEHTFKVTVTDSRGRKAEQTLTRTPVSYTAPSISATVFRALDDRTQSDMAGEYLRIIANVSWEDDLTSNNLVLKWRYKLSTTSTWGAYETLAEVPTDTLPVDYLSSGIFSIGSSYDVQVYAEDDFRSTSVQYRISNALFPIDIIYNSTGGSGIAFGKPATKHGMLDLAWPIRVQEDKGIISRGGLRTLYIQPNQTKTFALYPDSAAVVFVVRSNRDSIFMITTWDSGARRLVGATTPSVSIVHAANAGTFTIENQGTNWVGVIVLGATYEGDEGGVWR